MAKQAGPIDKNVQQLIVKLKRTKSSAWRAISEQLSKPRRLRSEVNLDKINKYAEEKAVVAVAGKILAKGRIDKKITITALSASKAALNKIAQSGSSYVHLSKYVEKNPKGKGVLLMK